MMKTPHERLAEAIVYGRPEHGTQVTPRETERTVWGPSRHLAIVERTWFQGTEWNVYYVTAGMWTLMASFGSLEEAKAYAKENK